MDAGGLVVRLDADRRRPTPRDRWQVAAVGIRLAWPSRPTGACSPADADGRLVDCDGPARKTPAKPTTRAGSPAWPSPPMGPSARRAVKTPRSCSGIAETLRVRARLRGPKQAIDALAFTPDGQDPDLRRRSGPALECRHGASRRIALVDGLETIDPTGGRLAISADGIVPSSRGRMAMRPILPLGRDRKSRARCGTGLSGPSGVHLIRRQQAVRFMPDGRIRRAGIPTT